MVPATGVVTFDEPRRTYRLAFSGTPRLTLELDLTHPDNAGGRLAVRHVQSNRFPVAGAGLYYRSLDRLLVEPRFMGVVGRVTSVQHEALPDGVRLTVHEELEGVPHAKRYSLRMVGHALQIRAESLDPPGPADGAYVGFGGGDVEGTSDGADVRVPYMAAVPVTMLDHRWFVSSLPDYYVSRAGQILPRGPESRPGGFTNEVALLYPPDVAGKVGVVDETVWVTVSRRIEDAFVALPGGASAGRSALVGRVAVGLTSNPAAVTFDAEASYLARLRAWGIRDLLVVKERWQASNAAQPVQGPPAPSAGGMEGLARLAQASGLLAPSRAYTLTVPGCPERPNPHYRAGEVVRGTDGALKRLADGSPGATLCTDASFMPRYLLAPAGARRAAAVDTANLAALGRLATYLPVLTAWNPAAAWPGAADNVLDRTTAAPNAPSIGAAVREYKTLLTELRAGGPVVGEGATGFFELGFDTFYAGYLDGLLRSLASGSPDQPPAAGALVAPDFELRMVRPRVVGYGMGPYGSFFGPDGVTAPLMEQSLDLLRAFSLSYGHAGAWWLADPVAPGPLPEAEQGKEYFLMRALQGRYLDAELESVRYWTADQRALDLSAALREDLDLAGPRLEVRYEAGLRLWVNHSEPVWTVTVQSVPYALPRHGWLAMSADGLLAYSALVAGRRVDYLWTPDYLLLDGRGQVTSFGPHSARDLKVVFADGRVLEEAPDGTLRMIDP